VVEQQRVKLSLYWVYHLLCGWGEELDSGCAVDFGEAAENAGSGEDNTIRGVWAGLDSLCVRRMGTRAMTWG